MKAPVRIGGMERKNKEMNVEMEEEWLGVQEIDDHSRTIVHFDLDYFYGQVEEVLDPSLKGKPLGQGFVDGPN